jgi:SulP family sulfate permease
MRLRAFESKEVVMIALLEARRAGLLAPSCWPQNIVAGIIVGVVALPLAMAFAIASGARPEQGLYTAIIGGACVSIFGGSRVQIAGPTGAFVAILAAVTAKYGIPGLEMATLMGGVILVIMGMTKMGALIRFIPAPVIVGFTAGIGIIIFVGQWRDFLGLPPVSGEHFHQRLWHLIQALPQLNLPTTALAILSLLLVVYAPRVKVLTRIPGPLLAMTVATILEVTLQPRGVATLGSAFGGIPLGLPAFVRPDLNPSHLITLIGPAFTIALLGAIESLLSAVVADGMTGTRHNSNQELIGQGIANILTPLFGGFAATGAIARTATNVRNGGTSPVAGMAHAVTLLAVLLFLAPMASNIPLASLSAILFFVAWNMSESRQFVLLLRRAPFADRGILIITFLLTVFVDLVVAVNVGVILAVLQFVRRMAETVDARSVGARALQVELQELGVQTLPASIVVYEIAGPMFFGAVENFRRPLLEMRPLPQTLILRLDRVPFMDVTGIQTLEEVIGKLHKRTVSVLLCEANSRVYAKLHAVGVLGTASESIYCETLRDALLRAGVGALGRT